uniref:Uncharacterized protein n=1 Tax=Arundo donax TaxID=35708 RepID=A0A0A8Z1Y0_ARUDO
MVESVEPLSCGLKSESAPCWDQLSSRKQKTMSLKCVKG